ncbi:HAD family hydrolase [Micromonospora sp. WMMD1120]|uniref:HAD family hydrolase n=1 Tax=Micromonospora sp. WMMD1120 TaxID=3016106 RepID=UPI002417C8E7|nr:HAD family hydrolase [Micromonospora sp. WMMD1120]MDG4806563.1 HAD family hydrolase [Micromonospora sp. WMMD1120]
MLTTVVFDADETLLDLRPAVTGGLVTVLDEMRRRTPAAAEVTLADLESDWGAVFGEMSAAPVMEIRRAALARSLARAELGDHLDEIADLFFARRFALTRPFPDVPLALRALRSRYTLGFATNGNSRAERCGLAGEFAFEVYAHEGGLPKKPAPEFFAAVVAAAGVLPEQIVYVGDSWEHDVVAPRRAGLRSVWLNRIGLPRPRGVTPDAEVSTLADLPSVLAEIPTAADLPVPGDVPAVPGDVSGG